MKLCNQHKQIQKKTQVSLTLLHNQIFHCIICPFNPKITITIYNSYEVSLENLALDQLVIP